jgi:hypothetical protein
MLHLGTINEDDGEDSDQKSEYSVDLEAERKKQEAKEAAAKAREIQKEEKKQSKNSVGIQALASYFGMRKNKEKKPSNVKVPDRNRPLGLDVMTSSDEEEYDSEEEVENSRKAS